MQHAGSWFLAVALSRSGGARENVTGGRVAPVTSDPDTSDPDCRAPAGISSPARRFEFKPLAVVAVIAAVGFGFVEFADAVMEGETRAFDEWLLRALREGGNLSDPIGPAWFEELV